ncbi:thioether cross-link-forming SCIFF peptide maturase [Miniphocaeibacter halophilus]|uniref:Thioether cross-link-forming SCIFF peptide maturase n=1 Tax=Miniphocaeibacter halophilus TaxID=2931922 RepID=A0AC61MRT8_9FIRM|nr:thioether cross-link-forming SCIFF peptide maturase [Miniphocaeibacter halophilus]QQK07038.1 thioether cross-link-forming SCIFF peptide maturase [Miniphocaeibacter halophilus]
MIHKYKMNNYNIVLDIYGGAVHVVDDISYDILDYYKTNTKEEIISILDNYPKEKVAEAYDEIQEMENQGLLFTSDDYLNIDEFEKREPVLKAMCLHVVHDCNLKCKYCFASQGDFGGHKAYMSSEVGKKALDYLVANSGSRKALEVDFFGGEPLMDFDLVKELVEYGNEIAEKNNKYFRFTITTNGILLDDDKIDYINKHMHNVVLSLDGRREINDEMRPTLNDKGSYDIIVPKYQKLIQGRKNKYYYVRGTFTRKNLDFSKDVKLFKDLGFDLASVEPVVDADYNEYAIREEDLPTILQEYENLAIDYAKAQVAGDAFKFFHFMVDLTQGPCVIKRMSGCGAGCEYVAVTPEGDIYPCHQFVGNEKFKMANILDEKVELPREMQNEFLNCHVFSKEECRDCWNKFYCSGGCHANAYNFNGDIMKPYEVGCEMQKKRTECAIMVKVAKMMQGESI